MDDNDILGRLERLEKRVAELEGNSRNVKMSKTWKNMYARAQRNIENANRPVPNPKHYPTSAMNNMRKEKSGRPPNSNTRKSRRP